MIKLLILGFLLGVQHAFDSDHLIAVTTITGESKNLKTSSKIGAIWGAGHTFTLLIIGFFLMTLNLTIPPTWGIFFENIIAIILILLGLNLLYKIHKEKIHLHKHTHNGTTHAHLHSHKKSITHHHNHLRKSFIIGTLHGLAGSAGLMLLILATVNTLPQGLAYILFFGIGSMAGMTIISTLISLPFLATQKFQKTHEWIQISAGSVSIMVGVGMML